MVVFQPGRGTQCKDSWHGGGDSMDGATTRKDGNDSRVIHGGSGVDKSLKAAWDTFGDV